MARREQLVTITDEGRDKGKTFLLRELSADAGEWWAWRALILLANSGTSMDAEVMNAGMAGLAYVEKKQGAASALFMMGLRMLPGVKVDDLKPLLDEMMECVRYVPPASGITGAAPGPQVLVPGDLGQIEELATRGRLRKLLLELHLGFSLAGAVSTSDTTPPAPPAT